MLHQNIRGVHKNLAELQVAMKTLKTLPQVIVLTETRKTKQAELIPGYHYFYNEGNINKCDGVIVYVSKNIDNFDNNRDHTVVQIGEIKVVETVINCNDANRLHLTSVYRSPQVPTENFVREFKSYLTKCQKYKNLIVIGDINIDIFNENVDVYRDYMDNYAELGYKSYINGVTRKESGTCIDHIFGKAEFQGSQGYIIQEDITDHFAIALTVDLEYVKRNKQKNKTFVDQKVMKTLCDNIDWSFFTEPGDINGCTLELVDRIKYVIESSKKTVKVKSREGEGRNDWITKDLIEKCKFKKKLSILSKSNPKNSHLKNKYNNYR